MLIILIGFVSPASKSRWCPSHDGAEPTVTPPGCLSASYSSRRGSTLHGREEKEQGCQRPLPVRKTKIAAMQRQEQERRKEQIEKEEVWDPIDARVELDRGAYIYLIKCLIDAEIGDKDLEAALEKVKGMQDAGE